MLRRIPFPKIGSDLGPATTQNLVVKFDGEICGGVLVENASEDFPSKRELENLLPNFAGSSPPISPKTSPTSLWKSLVLNFLEKNNPEGPARHLDASRQKLTAHCLAAIFDSQLPSPKLSLKLPPKLPLPHKRGHFFLFQNCPCGEGNSAVIERQSRQFLPRGIEMPLRDHWKKQKKTKVCGKKCLQVIVVKGEG